MAGTWNGVAFTAWNGAAITSWDGTGISCGSSLASFSDNFNRTDADSLGANWTEINDADIVSNQANSPITFDFSHRGGAYTGTPCATVDQYVKVTAIGASGTRPGIVLRYTDGSSPCYSIEPNESDGIYLNHYSTPTGTRTNIASQLTSFTYPTTIGVTVKGTGTGTVWRVWIGPTADAPDAGGTTWDGAGPTLTFNDDPPSPVNTGNYVGIGGIGSSGALIWDNFFGGDIP